MAVPVVTPFKTPFVPIVATEVFALLHTPPGMALLRVMDEPVHTTVGPVMVPAPEITTTPAVALATHPAELVNVSEGVNVPDAE